MDEQLSPGEPVVTDDDVESIREKFMPGSTQTVASIYTVYVRLMESQRRPIAHRTSLGHALRRASWTRVRLRKRVAGKPTEESAWAVPGAPNPNEDHDNVMTVLGDLGEGEHPSATIFQRYGELGRRYGWRGMMSETQLARMLTKMGYIRTTKRGVPCRIVLNRKP